MSKAIEHPVYEPKTTLHYHRCQKCNIIMDCEGDYCIQPECKRCTEGQPW